MQNLFKKRTLEYNHSSRKIAKLTKVIFKPPISKKNEKKSENCFFSIAATACSPNPARPITYVPCDLTYT